jgi:rhodanese-related sulfurtransferase
MSIDASLVPFLMNNWPLVLALVASGAMLLWPLVQRGLGSSREVGALAATQLINRQNALMIDLREGDEYAAGRVPNALHIPLSQLESRAKELARFTSRPVIAYCDRGQRSRGALAKLSKLGFAEVFMLQGGLRGWADAGMPLEKS